MVAIDEDGGLFGGVPDGGGGGERERPLFSIVPEDDPSLSFVHSDAQKAIDALYERLRAVHAEAASQIYLQYPHEPGYFFGWLHAPVQRTLHGDTVDAEGTTVKRLPINRSGCARTEPIAQLVTWRTKPKPDARMAFNDAALKAVKRMRDDGGGSSADPMDHEKHLLAREALPPGNVEKLRSLNTLARGRFKVARSNIHGWGLFVWPRLIPKGEMLIEYQGDLIRSSLSDIKMKKYTQMGIPGDCYIFRVDENVHVDATMAGNIARFMNHSCQPNCYSKIVEVGKASTDKHIVVYAARDLQPGEELQYDYQFALGGDKIECHCGAPSCWGRMN